jgi:adenylylsulfate reductase subunit A
MEIEEMPAYVETDVLILGGGAAGVNAAIAAKEQNPALRVLIVEKAGNIERSGNTAAGVDHNMGIMEEGEYWDTPEGVLKNLPEITDDMTPVVTACTFVQENRQRILAMEKLGMPYLHDPKTGRYIRTPGFGLTGSHWIHLEGFNWKPILAKEALRLGAQVQHRIMVTNLLTDQGQVIGAMGFHVRTGRFFVFTAQQVILTVGDVVRYGTAPSGSPFDTWHCPANTGDGQAMAFRAGAELANMEFGITTLIPGVFAAAGMNAFFGQGGRLLNAKGEEFMLKYDPKGNKANRFQVARGVYQETIGGRGPIYLDVTHLPPAEVDHLLMLITADKPTYPEWFAQKKLDLHKEPMEISISAMNSCGAVGPANGAVVDADGATTLPGLFAAGDCSWFMLSTSGAATMGYHAGKVAAQRCQGGKTAQPDKKAIQKEQARVLAPLEDRPRFYDLSPKEFEDRIRQLMATYVGLVRNEEGLKLGVQKLEDLREWIPSLRARNLHELLRANEAQNLLDACRLIACAALERKESRLGLYHHRSDFPEKDDLHFKKFVILKRDQDRIKVSLKPVEEAV